MCECNSENGIDKEEIKARFNLACDTVKIRFIGDHSVSVHVSTIVGRVYTRDIPEELGLKIRWVASEDKPNSDAKFVVRYDIEE